MIRKIFLAFSFLYWLSLELSAINYVHRPYMTMAMTTVTIQERERAVLIVILWEHGVHTTKI